MKTKQQVVSITYLIETSWQRIQLASLDVGVDVNQRDKQPSCSTRLFRECPGLIGGIEGQVVVDATLGFINRKLPRNGAKTPCQKANDSTLAWRHIDYGLPSEMKT